MQALINYKGPGKEFHDENHFTFELSFTLSTQINQIFTHYFLLGDPNEELVVDSATLREDF